MSGERKVLLLTGASRGIGHATVQRFSDAGWRIITCSRETVPAECKRDPNWTHHITADLGDPGDLAHFVAEAEGFSRRPAARARQQCRGFAEIADPRAARHAQRRPRRLASGVSPEFFCAADVVANLSLSALARGAGAIVNVTSIAGHQVHPFAGSAYATSKAALSALTREMAADFARLGVRVNAVAPGEIETAMLSPETAVLLPRIPLNRLGIPSDVAGTIFFLCSEDAAYVTGTEISVNGGQHIY